MKNKEIDAMAQHYKTHLGDFEVLDYLSSNDLPFKPQLIWSKPNKTHKYHVISTVGVSDIKLKGIYNHCEFAILLDKNWKFKLDNANHNWPLELLHKVSNIAYLTKEEIGFGKYFVNEGNKSFAPITNMGVALVCIPAMFDSRFFELKSGKKLVNFFVITTATMDELKLIKHIGGINFIQRYLLPEGEDAFIIKK